MASEVGFHDVIEVDLDDIEGVFAEMASLSKAEGPFEELAGALLSRTVQLLAAVGGAVWLADEQDSFRLVDQVNLEAIGEDQKSAHRQMLLEAFRDGDMQVRSADLTQSAREPVANATGYHLVFGPIRSDRSVTGIVEIIQRPSVSAAALRGNLRFLGLVCELASDHLRRRELQSLRQSQAHAEEFDSFICRLHSTLDLKAVAYELANEGRRFVGCDRISLAKKWNRRHRLVTVSGVDTIDRRSNAVRRLEDLATVVAKTGKPLWIHAGDEELPPQITEPLCRYLEEADVRTIGIFPLKRVAADEFDAQPDDYGRGRRADRGTTFGVLIIEQFDGRADADMRDQTVRVVEHGRLAIWNASRYHSLPTLPFARRRNLMPHQSHIGIATWLVLLIGAGFAAAMFLIPAEFRVRAEGQLQPQQRQEVFAPLDGRVTELAARNGQYVAVGDLLVQLSSPELDVEIERVQGELEVARKRLLVVESTLLQQDRSAPRSDVRSGQLAAEKEELLKVLESQSKQMHLLLQQREQLTIRSPLDGQVLTWDLEQLLTDRPVQRGQSLLSVGNLAGRWVAEVKVPDDRIGYLLAAQSATGQPLAASFQLATERRDAYQGVIRHVAARTELDRDKRSTVKVAVDFDETQLPEMRPGATIFARIDCGAKPLGYVWFHDLIELIRGWITF